MANSLRYGYLKGQDGRFHNPYDSGCRKNCVDFLLVGYNEDIDVPWEPIQQMGGMVQLGNRYELELWTFSESLLVWWAAAWNSYQSWWYWLLFAVCTGVAPKLCFFLRKIPHLNYCNEYESGSPCFGEQVRCCRCCRGKLGWIAGPKPWQHA